MSDIELDFAALNRYLQTLDHLFIDIGRIKSEQGYEEKEGGYGDVRVATLDPGTATPRLVAAKTIRLRARDKPPERLAFRLVRELSIWAGLQHPHVLPLVGYFLDPDYKTAVLISDYMIHGDLMEYLEQNRPSWDMRLRLIRGSTDALAYLHGQNPPICHCDLKTKNVLINGELQAMLADFGLSKALDDEPTGLTTSDDLKGTLQYNSPEIMSGSYHSLASDIWAWGCLFLEVLTDKRPYATKRTPEGIVLALVTGELPSDPENLPITVPDLKGLLAMCWNRQPNERPSAAYCLSILNSVPSASNDGHHAEETAAQQNPMQAGLWPIDFSTSVTTFGSAGPPQDNAGGDSQPNVEESKVEDTMDVTEDDLDLRNSVEPIHAASPPLINWTKGKLIGLSAYVPVHFALNVTTREQMAVKEVRITRYQRYRDYLRLVRIIKALETEQRTLQKLDHPNVVQYLGFQKSERRFKIFFEYVPGGSIGSCLRSYGKMKENTIKSFAGQIANALAYLHANKIIHGNIKAENAFLDYSGQCKIGEFTRSQEREEIYKTAFMEPIRGSVFWTAPEMLPGNLKGYSGKVDMWSFGCTVLAMLSGKRPWPEADEVVVFNNIGRNIMIPPAPANVHLSAGAGDFLLKCLIEDQDERPTAEALQTHPWLTLPDGWMFTGFH